MKKKTSFQIFKDECLRLQKKFGLIDYNLYFEHKTFDERYAEIKIDETGCVAMVKLDKKTKSNIKEIALHEMVHLITNRLRWIGQCRYINDCELQDEWERLTVKLTALLND